MKSKALIILLILSIVCIYLFKDNIVSTNVLKDLEDEVMQLSNKEDNLISPEYLFDDTINEADLVDLPDGYIYVVFNFTYSNEKVLDFINQMDKKKYLGVKGDVHFIQMNTTSYEELFQICFDLQQNDIVSSALVEQKMFEDTLKSKDIEAFKSNGVVYLQYIPDGNEAEIDQFIDYASNLDNTEFLGLYQNSLFLRFNNSNYDDLNKICSSISYPNNEKYPSSISYPMDGYIIASILE
jgi:hypothetical protein